MPRMLRRSDVGSRRGAVVTARGRSLIRRLRAGDVRAIAQADIRMGRLDERATAMPTGDVRAVWLLQESVALADAIRTCRATVRS